MKNFDAEHAARVANVDQASLLFQLGGKTLKRAQEVPAWVMFNVADLSRRTEDGEEGGDLSPMFDAMMGVIAPESQQVWEELARSRTSGVSWRDLNDVLNWAIGEDAQRPTTASTDSSAGRSTTGTTSTLASPSAESTPERSLSVASATSPTP